MLRYISARKRVILRSIPFAVAITAGCSMFQWSGNYVRPQKDSQVSGPSAMLQPFRLPSRAEEEQSFGIHPSSGTKKRETFTERDLKALYYYDMGPEEIDVSQYPGKQQDNYTVFRQVCSRCHTLARPINSPRSGYWAWDFYIFNMRLRSQFDSQKTFTKDQAKQILDFLTYDSKIRKGRNRAAFEVLTKELERRFDRMLGERIQKMQEGHPLLLRQTE